MHVVAVLPTVVLKSGRERALRHQHPWIFSGAIDKRPDRLNEGATIQVIDSEGSFLGIGHYSEKGSIAVKLFSYESRPIDLSFWRSKVRAAIRLRQSLGLPNSATTAYRLIHAEGDGLPGLVVDRYGDTLVIELHSSGMEQASTVIQEALSLELPEVKHHCIGQAGSNSESSREETVLENGLAIQVACGAGQKTGYFLDQRENRFLLRRYTQGKRVLDCFCYTGGFTLNALAAGASLVESVDSSRRALGRLEENVRRNFPELPSTQAVTQEVDALQYLHDIPHTFEVMVLDPPAFVKTRAALRGGLIGYETINLQAMRHLQPGGILFTFSCSQQVDQGLFVEVVQRAASRSKRKVRVLHELSQAPCHPWALNHPEGKYLKGLVLQVEGTSPGES